MISVSIRIIPSSPFLVGPSARAFRETQGQAFGTRGRLLCAAVSAACIRQ